MSFTLKFTFTDNSIVFYCVAQFKLFKKNAEMYLYAFQS